MPPSTERKDFEATRKMRGVMGKYFTELSQGRAEGKKTAWCTSVGPAELLRALGFNVYFPENHGAMLGATRMATDLIPLANARGFSPDICSYLTSDVGSYLKGESPIQKMNLPGPPKADVLVYNTNQCRDVQDWFAWYGRRWSRPVLGVECYRGVGDVHWQTGFAAQQRWHGRNSSYVLAEWRVFDWGPVNRSNGWVHSRS